VAKGPKVLDTDVLVVGGGPAGTAAAVASARAGAKTTLIERYGFLGGMATAALVNPFMVSKTPAGELIMSPLFKEIIGELEKRKACVRGQLFGQPHIAFDPEELKSILLDLCNSSGIKLYLHSEVSEVVLRENRFSGVDVHFKSEQFRIMSKVAVDATGDADLAFLAGVPHELGRPQDGAMQPATLYFRAGGVDTSKMPSREKMDEMFVKARDEGRVKILREKLLWFETTRAGELNFNVTRIIGIDGTKVEDITRAEVEGRAQVEQLFAFLKDEMPGFGSSYILNVAPQAGIRETRRIVGEYVLTGEDVLSGVQFNDAIAKCSYPIDIHSPKGMGTVFKPLSKPYDIPYRCLIPKKIENLIVAGRPISVDYEAFSSTRVMPTCFAVGEAAGIAAAFSVKSRVIPRKLDVSFVQRALNR
jgi:hypothetical protein